MEDHPEIKNLLNDFISSILLHAPVIHKNTKKDNTNLYYIKM